MPIGLTVLLVIVGVVKKQPLRYWKFAALAVITQSVVFLLFNAGGTLQDPRGDGIITHMLRVSSNDGPIIAALAIPVIIVGWAFPLWLAQRGYVRPGAPDSAPTVPQAAPVDKRAVG